MATTTGCQHGGSSSLKQNRIGIATLRFQNRKYQFPSIIVRNNGKQQCIMLDVCLLCPFCTGDINARIIPLESRVLLAQGQNRHSYPPAGPDVVMQCEDLATSFAQQFPHLLSPRSRHHLMHCNLTDRLSQSADERMMTQPNSSKSPTIKPKRLTFQEVHEIRAERIASTSDASAFKVDVSGIPPKARHTIDALDSTDSAEGDSTQTSDTDSVDSVRYAGDKYSTVKRAFPHDVIRGEISESIQKTESSQDTVKRSPKPPRSPRSSPKHSRKGNKSPPSESDKKTGNQVAPAGTGERTTAVVVKSTIHQTVAELLDLPSESDSEETGEKDKTDTNKNVRSLDNIRSASQLSDYGSMESMSNSHERLRRSRSEGMGSMDSQLHSTKKRDTTPKSEIKAVVGTSKELPESITKEFEKLRSKVKKTDPDMAWSYDDLRKFHKGASVGSTVPFRHSDGDKIATVYPVFEFRREASPRGRPESNTRQSPNTSQINAASQSSSSTPNITLMNQTPQLDVNANIDPDVDVATSQLQQDPVAMSEDKDADEMGIEDAEKEMERVVGEMTSLEAELEQMYRMTAKSRQHRPAQDGATNLGDSSTTFASLQERQRIEQEEIERMQELEDERRRPFVAEPRSDKKPNGKNDKQSKRVPREEAQFEEEERRVQLWLREQQKRQKILQKQNLTQQDRRRLQIMNEQRRQQLLQERLRLQLEARNQQTQPVDPNIPSAMSQEDVKRRQTIKEKLQRQAEQLHRLQMQALYQQQPTNERQAEAQWQAIQEHHQRLLQEQAEIANQNSDSKPGERKVKPPVPPKPIIGVPRVRNLVRKDETPPQVRRMRNVMSYLEGSSQEAIDGNKDKKSRQGKTGQPQNVESNTSSNTAESHTYLYEDEAMASLENEDLNFYDEENDQVIDRTGETSKKEDAECLIQDPEDVYAQHIQAKDISQMLDILERVVDGSKKKDDDSSSSEDEDMDITDKDPEETVDEILENIDTDSYSPNATLSKVFTTPRRKRQMMTTVDENDPTETVGESEDQTHELTLDEVLECMESVIDSDTSQLFDSVIQSKKEVKEEKSLEAEQELHEETQVPQAVQLTTADLVPPRSEEKRSSSTECLPDDNTSLEMERSICYSENTSETMSYDEDSLDLQVAEAKLSRESSAEIKQMIVRTHALTDVIMNENQQIPADHSEVRMRMLSPISEEKSNRSSAISSRSSGVLSDGRSPRSSDAMTDTKSNRSSAMSSDLLTDLSSDKRSSRSTDVTSTHSYEPLSNRSSLALSTRSSQDMETVVAVEDIETPTMPYESSESQTAVQSRVEEICVTPSKSEDSGDILVDESMLIEPMSRSVSASPGDHILLTSSESESGGSLQRRLLSRSQYHQLSPYAYEYGDAVGHELREPVHIRLYPSVEDMIPHRLPPEQADHQLTVMTDSLSLDNVFQEGQPAISHRSPQILSPPLNDQAFPTESQRFMIEDTDIYSQMITPPGFMEEPIKPDQMDMMVEKEDKIEHIPVIEAKFAIKEEKSREIQPPHGVIAIAEVHRADPEQAASYTLGQQNLDIIEITTEVSKRKLSTDRQMKEAIQPQGTPKETPLSHDATGPRNKVQETTDVSSSVKSAETLQTSDEITTITTSEDVPTYTKYHPGIAPMMFTVNLPAGDDSSSESLDISSEEDEITNVIELIHKVKKEYEAEVPKFEGQVSQNDQQEQKQPKSDSDSGSEVVIDESGSGEVFKIKLDRQSSLHFQRLSRENSLRGDDVDEISDEFAFNMHVRSLERLASLSREALNVQSDNSQPEATKENSESGEVMQKEIEAINRLESLITVDSEPTSPESSHYIPGLDDVLLVDELGVPLEMSCSMESIEEVDEKLEEIEGSEIQRATIDLEQSLSQTSQLDIIIEEEDLASQDSKTSSPSKKSIDAPDGVIVEPVEDSLMEDNVSRETDSSFANDDNISRESNSSLSNDDNISRETSSSFAMDDNVSRESNSSFAMDDNVSAETSSSFAISEGSTNSGQPDLLHNVIVCAGATMKRGSDSDSWYKMRLGSDSDSIQIDSDSSSDGFGSTKSATLKIQMTSKKPPIHPSTETKSSTNYGDIILGRDDRESTPEGEMAIFNFKQALAMFEGMSSIHGGEEPETKNLEDDQDQESSYVASAISSHELFMKEATFGKRKTEHGEQMPANYVMEQTSVSENIDSQDSYGTQIQAMVTPEIEEPHVARRTSKETEIAEININLIADEKTAPEVSVIEVPEAFTEEMDESFESVDSVKYAGTVQTSSMAMTEDERKVTNAVNPQLPQEMSENHPEKPCSTPAEIDIGPEKERSKFSASRTPSLDTESSQVIVSEAFEKEDAEREIVHVKVKVEETTNISNTEQIEDITERDVVAEHNAPPKQTTPSDKDTEILPICTTTNVTEVEPCKQINSDQEELMTLPKKAEIEGNDVKISDVQTQHIKEESAKQEVSNLEATNDVQEVEVEHQKSHLIGNETTVTEVDEVREISPVAVAACDGVDVFTSLEKVKEVVVIPSCANQLDSPTEETVEVMPPSSPDQSEPQLYEGDLSTIQIVSQEESMVSETGELQNADSCAELSSRESETSDVTVITSSVLDSTNDIAQEPTQVREMTSPSPDQVSLLSSSEDLRAEGQSTPAVELSTSHSSQEASFVMEREKRLSLNDVNNLTPVPFDHQEEVVVKLQAAEKDLVDFENSHSSQEASFVIERKESPAVDDIRDITPVPEDKLCDDVCEIDPGYDEVSHGSIPDILIADYDEISHVRSDEDIDKRSTIDSQKSAITLIQAVSKSSDTEEVVAVSPDVTQISLLEQQAEYQRYKDEMSSSMMEQSSSSARSSVLSTQEKFESYMDVNKEEVELEVPNATLNQQTGLVLVKPGTHSSKERHVAEESDSFDDWHRSPSFQRHRPRRSPSTSSSEKASMTYSQEKSFETSYDSGQPITEWHASRTATYESQGNVLYHEESQISSDTEGSLRRKRKVLIKRPSADSNDFETQTFVKEDVSPSPVFQPACNIVAIRTDSVSEGEEGDDEKGYSGSSSSTGSREGSFVRFASTEDVNDILDKVRAVIFEASKYKQEQEDSSMTETNDQSNGELPDESLSESGVGATEQEIKDYFINREDEGLKQKEAETEEFLRNILHRHHHQHVTKESDKCKNDVTDVSACLEEVCRALSESDSDEIVIDEDVETQEVTLVFAWPKSLKPAFQHADKPYREIFMRRITKIRDVDFDIMEGPELSSISASCSQPDTSSTEAGNNNAGQSASSKDNTKSTAADAQQCQAEGEKQNECKSSEKKLKLVPIPVSNLSTNERNCMVSNKVSVSQNSLPVTNQSDEAANPSRECNRTNMSPTQHVLSDVCSVSECVEGSGNCGEDEKCTGSEKLQCDTIQKGTMEHLNPSDDQLSKLSEVPVTLEVQNKKQEEYVKAQNNEEGNVTEISIEQYATEFCQIILANALKQVQTIYQQVEDKIAQHKANTVQRRLHPALDLGVPNSPVPIRRVIPEQASGSANASNRSSSSSDEYLLVKREVEFEEKWTSPIHFMQKTSATEVIRENTRHETINVSHNTDTAVTANTKTTSCASVTSVSGTSTTTFTSKSDNLPISSGSNTSSSSVMTPSVTSATSPVSISHKSDDSATLVTSKTFPFTSESTLAISPTMSSSSTFVTQDISSTSSMFTSFTPTTLPTTATPYRSITSSTTVTSSILNPPVTSSSSSGVHMSQSMHDSGIECHESKSPLSTSLIVTSESGSFIDETTLCDSEIDDNDFDNVQRYQGTVFSENDVNSHQEENNQGQIEDSDNKGFDIRQERDNTESSNQMYNQISILDSSQNLTSSKVGSQVTCQVKEVKEVILDRSCSVKDFTRSRIRNIEDMLGGPILGHVEVCDLKDEQDSTVKIMEEPTLDNRPTNIVSVADVAGVDYISKTVRGADVTIKRSKEDMACQNVLTTDSQNNFEASDSKQSTQSKALPKARGNTIRLDEMLAQKAHAIRKEGPSHLSIIDNKGELTTSNISVDITGSSKARGNPIGLEEMMAQKVHGKKQEEIISDLSMADNAEQLIQSTEVIGSKETDAAQTCSDHTDSDESVNSLLDKLEIRYPSEIVDPVIPVVEACTIDIDSNIQEEAKVEIIREYTERIPEPDDDNKSDELVIFPTETKTFKISVEKPVSLQKQEPKLGRQMVSSAEDLLYPDLVKSARKKRQSGGISDLLTSMLGCSLPELSQRSEAFEEMSKSVSEQRDNDCFSSGSRGEPDEELSKCMTRSDSGINENIAIRAKLETMSPLGALHVDVKDYSLESAELTEANVGQFVSASAVHYSAAEIGQDSNKTTSSSNQESSDTTSTTTTQSSDDWLIDHYDIKKLKLPPSFHNLSSSDDNSDDTLTNSTITEVEVTKPIASTNSVIQLHIESKKMPEIKLVPSVPVSGESDTYSEICDAVLSGSEGAPSTASTSVDSDRASISSHASTQPSTPPTKLVAVPKGIQAPRTPRVNQEDAKLVYTPLNKKQVYLHSKKHMHTPRVKPDVTHEEGSTVCDDIWTPNTKRHAQALRGRELSELIQEQKSMFAKLQEMRTSFDELLHEVETVKIDMWKDDENIQGPHMSLYENIARLRPLSGIDHQLADQKQNVKKNDASSSQIGQSQLEALQETSDIYQPQYPAIDEDVHDFPPLYSLTRRHEKPIERSISSPVLSPEIHRREDKREEKQLLCDMTVSSPCLSPEIIRKPKVPMKTKAAATPSKQKVLTAMEKLRQPVHKSCTLPDDILKRADKVRWADEFMETDSDQKRKYSSSPQIGKASFKDVNPDLNLGAKFSGGRTESVDDASSRLGEALGVRRAFGLFGSAAIRSRSLDSRVPRAGYQMDRSIEDEGNVDNAQCTKGQASGYSEFRNQRSLDLEARNKQFRSQLLSKGKKDDKHKTVGGFFKRFTQGKKEKE